MYELYIANKNYSSWSLRLWALMRELGIPFVERLVPFSGASSWKAFRKFSPTGRVPCLHDRGAVVWDSLGITEYLAERHAGVWPLDAGARAWARSAAAEMHSGFAELRNRCSMNCGLRVRLNAVTAALRGDIDRLGELWNEGIGRFGGPYLAGDAFSAVDAFFAPVAFRAQTYGIALDEVSSRYVRRLLDLPSLRNWYADALAERWRDAQHEAEVQDAGSLLADLRAAPDLAAMQAS
jgi:glutathione S-transferase